MMWAIREGNESSTRRISFGGRGQETYPSQRLPYLTSLTGAEMTSSLLVANRSALFVVLEAKNLSARCWQIGAY